MSTIEHTLTHHDEVEMESFGDNGFIDAAVMVRENPRCRMILDLFLSGEIHNYFGGSLRAVNGTERVFWHDRGTFIAPNGAIYHIRADDAGVMQAYVSPVDERAVGTYCIQPYTYDGYRSDDGSEVRIDFVNGLHHAAPPNTIEEAELQRRDGQDAVYPRHRDGINFDSRRDSISVRYGDNGTCMAMMYDSATGLTTPLYDIVLVRRFIDELDMFE